MDWTKVYEWTLSAPAQLATGIILLLAVANLITSLTKVVKATEKLILAVQEIFSRRLRKEVKRGVTSQQRDNHEESILAAAILFIVSLLVPRSHAERRRRSRIGMALAAIGLGLYGSRYLVAQKLPPNARLTTKAWDALHKRDCASAIRNAQECIDRFQDEADSEQSQLKAGHVTVPKGVVPNDEKGKILRRGPLNDVATCFFIEGQADEKLGKEEQAKQAYEAAMKYPDARCFDPSWDGFWSPADAARGRLKRLKRHSHQTSSRAGVGQLRRASWHSSAKYNAGPDHSAEAGVEETAAERFNL